MKACGCPSPLTDLEIDMLLADEAPPAVVAHSRCCPVCATRVAAQAAAEAALHARLFRATCPNAMTLGEWQMGLLGHAEQEALAAHVALCPACQRDMAVLGEPLTAW